MTPIYGQRGSYGFWNGSAGRFRWATRYDDNGAIG